MSVKQLRAFASAPVCFGLTMAIFAGIAEAGPELRLGVVVDQDKQQVFLMRPEGGIEAVSWTTGETLWISEQGDRPLVEDDGRVLALVDADQPGAMTLVALAADSGKALKQSRLAMAPDLWAKVDDGLSTRFQITAQSADGEASLAWSYRSWTAQGIKPSRPSATAKNLKESAGSLAYRWADGELRQGVSRVAAPKADLLSAEQALQGVGEGRQFLSHDGRHVAVSRRIAHDPARFRYQWSLYTREGESVGNLQAETSYSPFLVQGSTLVVESPAARRRADAQSPWVETPLSLRAVDLRSGTELWTRPLRETRYQGPLPP